MKIGEILKTVGTGILKQVFPAAGAVIDIVNGFLPDDKKLDSGATGEQVHDAIQSLPPEDQSAIMSKRLDVKMAEIAEWSKVVGSLAEADKAGNSTRPDIAMMLAQTVCFSVVAIVAAFVIAVLTDNCKMIDAISDGWPLVLAALAPLITLLRAYFGLRTDEKKARYAASTGQSHISGIAGIISSVFKKGK